MTKLAEIWDAFYRRYWDEGLHRLERVSGVILGFHSVIDGLKRGETERLEKVFGDAALGPEVARRLDNNEIPAEIESPADLLVAMIDSMRKGKALQRMIRDEPTFNWLMETFGYDLLRMGGTSGNMANSLAPLGMPLAVHANPLTTELAELFVDTPNLKVICEENGKFGLIPPRQAAEGNGIRALHWIWEYPAGLKFNIAGREWTTPRANRFIAAWNPVNNQLRLQQDFRHGVPRLADRFSHFVVSGFHILSEEYPDGSTYAECLQPVAVFLAGVRKANPALKIHYEFASIASARIRRGIIDTILPRVDSLGLNEVELGAILRDMGKNELAGKVENSESVADIFRAVWLVAELAGLKRVQLHNLGYYLCLVRPEYANPEETRAALILAATLAASRSALGYVGERRELRKGLDWPISGRGMDDLQALAVHLGQPEMSASGIGTYGGYHVVFVPTRVVSNPVLTVGLGDLISALAFIAG
ncbi:MAG: hypothetical protein M1379_10065 [Firmicutes bacterium]|nr:hypothetical protein [Bacillota bacterium]